jgi:flagellin B
VADKTGVRATFDTTWISSKAISGGMIKSLVINGVKIGDLEVKAGDKNGALVNAINAVKDQTGVEASVNTEGRMVLTSRDGRAIKISGGTISAGLGGKRGTSMFIGRLNLVRLDGRDIKVKSDNAGGKFSVAFSKTNNSHGGNQQSVALRDVRGQLDKDLAAAMGFQRMSKGVMTSAQSAGVMTLRGAMAVMDIAESAQKTLDQIRSDLGSVQNQLVATVNNITVTQVNVKSAESQIRDVDFAAESANFSKAQLLAQSGSYAMSQANTVQQNVMRLLQ